MQENSDESLLRYYSEEVRFEGGSQVYIALPFEITSHQYLKYAEDDLNSDLSHRHINCLSNIKRAIHCQIDSLLYIFGLFDNAIQKRWDFPKKAAILKQTGVITPRILGKINKDRNLLEHGYLNPSQEVVEDALDVAELFVGYTDRFLTNPFCDASFRNKSETLVVIFELNHLERRFKINEIFSEIKEDGSKEFIKNNSYSISADSDVYLEYLRFWVEHLSRA